MLATFYRPTPSRNKILIEKKTFPSDTYAIKSFMKVLGYDPRECLVEICTNNNENGVLAMEDVEN